MWEGFLDGGARGHGREAVLKVDRGVGSFFFSLEGEARNKEAGLKVGRKVGRLFLGGHTHGREAMLKVGRDVAIFFP